MQEPATPDRPPETLQAPRSVHESAVRRALPLFYALVGALLVAILLLTLWTLKDVLLLVFISVLFAAAVSRPAALLERYRIPRAVAALLVYVVSLALLVGLLWFIVPTMVEQIAKVTDEAPTYAERYAQFKERYDRLAEQYPTLGTFDERVSAIQDKVVDGVGNRLMALPTRLFRTFLDLLAVFVISMLVMTSREKMLAFTLSMVHPKHRVLTERVLRKMWQRLGHYLRAKLIVMAIVGALTYGALLLIGVPYAVMLSVLVALGVLVPRVGPWVARIPLLIVAAFEGWTVFGLTFAAAIIIDNLKGMVISPFVEGDQLDIPPLLVFISILIGATLFGAVGAFVSVPAAAVVQVVFEEVIIPWRRRQLAPAEETVVTE